MINIAKVVFCFQNTKKKHLFYRLFGETYDMVVAIFIEE